MFAPARADTDIAAEVSHYLEQATAAHMKLGLSRDEALRAARLELGGETRVGEQVRVSGWEHIIAAAVTDLRYAARRLRAAPGFTAVSTLTLAVGIGATTAIFSAARPVLFDPLPYPDAGRIQMIVEQATNGSRNGGTFGMFRALVEQARSFKTMAVLKSWRPTLTAAGAPERLDGQRVSQDYFRTLGVRPLLGRDFQPADDQVNGPKVVILSNGVWRRRFGADPSLVGQSVRLNDDPYTVIGVMPPAFDNVLAREAEVWAPMQYGLDQGVAWGHHLATVGRLRDGVTEREASREVEAIGRSTIRTLRPVTYDSSTRLLSVSLRDDVTRAVRPAFSIIVGAVVLVLVIACVNVTNLLLARGAQRHAEFALRAALGAESGRLMRQLLVESLLLSAVGGIVGIAVAVFGVQALTAIAPDGLARIGAMRLDVATLAFGVGVTTVIALVFGLAPAMYAARTDPQEALQQGSRRTAGGPHRLRSALVVAEVAIALVLLVSSGLLLRSLNRLFAVPLGLDPANVVTMQVQTVGHRFDSDSVRNRFFAQALDAVRRVPGVTAAAFTTQLPLSGDRDEYGVTFGNDPGAYDAFRYSVTAGYFQTLRIPLRSGRLLAEDDRSGTPRVAVISESLARQKFGDKSPVGTQLRIGPPSAPPFTIVGVVGDVKQLSLALAQAEAVYTPADQWPFADAARALAVRTEGEAALLAPAVRNAVWSVDPNQPVVRIATMDGLLAASAADRRFALSLFEAFALAAVILAAAGIYGVLAGGVAERTRELGVRAALGASRNDIVGLVLRQGMLLTGAGAGIGVLGAFAASGLLDSMLFGITRLDAATYLGVVAVLAVVAVVACAVPAWRAARID
ncbi:MAG TPA: ABC transporter permease, partial [Gemmatimonadaceae bacterium]